MGWATPRLAQTKASKQAGPIPSWRPPSATQHEDGAATSGMGAEAASQPTLHRPHPTPIRINGMPSKGCIPSSFQTRDDQSSDHTVSRVPQAGNITSAASSTIMGARFGP